MEYTAGKVFEIAADPEMEVWEGSADALAPQAKSLPREGEWSFPAASVSAIELSLSSPLCIS
jgi:hypothetical protein